MTPDQPFSSAPRRPIPVADQGSATPPSSDRNAFDRDDRTPPPPGCGFQNLSSIAAGPAYEPTVIGQAGTALPHLPGFDVLEKLGQGGMGMVYKARQKSLNRLVALKMITAAREPTADQLVRFRVEAESAARVQHPNIVQIHDARTINGRPVLVMEYVDGPNLKEYCNSGPIPAEEAVHIVETVARAVHSAHQQGIVHRDLKPSNILLTRDGQPKVADFGLAKSLEATFDLTEPGMVVGTPGYMAPEQQVGDTKNIGPQTDIYALGSILYLLLTGQLPLPPGAAAGGILNDSPSVIPPAHLRREIPAVLDAICLKALRQTADPYPSALALANDLEKWRCQSVGQPTAEPQPHTVPSVLGRYRWMVAAGAMLAITATIVAVRGNSPPQSGEDAPTAADTNRTLTQTPSRMAIRVWRDDQSQDVLQAAPLRNGDRVRLECTIPHDVAAGLFLLDTSGNLKRLAAGTGGVLRYPADASQAAPVSGRPGTELFLVCGGNSQEPTVNEVQSCLVGNVPWPALPPQTVLRMTPQEVLVQQQGRDLGPPVTLADPQEEVRVLMDELRRRLSERFELIAGMAVSHME